MRRLILSLALATAAVGLAQPARADVDVTRTLSTVGSATYAHGTSSCTGSTVTGMRVTTFRLHTSASVGDPVRITVTPATADFDPGFALYDGAFDPSAAASGCYDTTNVAGPGAAETATYQDLVAATTYTIVVFGTSGDGGYSLHLTGPDLTSLASTPDAPQLVVGQATNSGPQVTTHVSVSHVGSDSAVTGFRSTFVDSTTHEQDDVSQATYDSGADLSVTGQVGDDLSLSVSATNAVGTGPSAIVRRAAAPTVVSLVPGGDGTSALLSWSAPAGRTTYDTLYAYPSQPGSMVAPPAPAVLIANPTVISGLAEGQTYAVHLEASNPLDVTDGPDTSVTTMSRPGVPTLSTTPATSTAGPVITVGAAPVAAGSNRVTRYTVTATAPGLETQTMGTGAPGPVPQVNLFPGVTYTLTATATNTVGTGAPSAPVTLTMPPSTVNARIYGVIPGPHTLRVYFAVPGGPVQLTAVPVGGGPPVTAIGTRSPLTVSGLVERRSYQLFVTNVGAVAVFGAGPRTSGTGPAPKLSITVPRSRVAVGRKATVSGTFTMASLPQQGETVVLSRTVGHHTVKLAKKLTDRHGTVRFSVVAVKGATYKLSLTLFDLKLSSKGATIKVR